MALATYHREFTTTVPTDATNGPVELSSDGRRVVFISEHDVRVYENTANRIQKDIPLNRHERRARDAKLRTLFRKLGKPIR